MEDTTQDKLEQLYNKLTDVTEQVNQIKQEIQDLTSIFEQQNTSKRWRADEDEKYYFIAGGGSIIDCQDNDSCPDNFRYEVGNYFKTEEQAQEYIENLKTKQELKDLALELNKGQEIDWTVKNVPYYIAYAYNVCELQQFFASDIQNAGQVYCLDEDFLKIAIERIGGQRLIKLIKSGV